MSPRGASDSGGVVSLRDSNRLRGRTAMTHRFPHQTVFLERTRLRYINLPGILSDGKVNREAQVSGFVVLFFGHSVGWIFLVHGEPVLGALLRPERRELVPVEWLRSAAERESERGQIAYYGAPEAQLRAMYATLAQEPSLRPTTEEAARAVRLIRRLESTGFSGVLEVRADEGLNYLVIQDGGLQAAYLADDAGEGSVSDVLEKLLLGRKTPASVVGFNAVDALPTQAPEALARLYLRVVESALADVARTAGAVPATACFREALERQREQHAELARVRVEADGRIEGVIFGMRERVTEAVAGWLFESLSAAGRAWELDAGDIVARAARPHRHAMEASGFLSRLPWPISW